MRLSDVQNEDAIDLLANIIEPAAKIMSDPEIEKAYRSKPMVLVVALVLKRHKKSAVEIVAAMHGKTPDEFKFNVVSLTKDIIEILNDPELIEVFSSQGQMTPDTPSGSAMENTMGDGQ